MTTQRYVLVAWDRIGTAAAEYIGKMKPETAITLVREQENQFDKLAIAVHVALHPGILKIGYLPKGRNKELATWMDETGNPSLAAILEYAGTGKSKYPGVRVEIP